jgi:hypothetical protein
MTMPILLLFLVQAFEDLLTNDVFDPDQPCAGLVRIEDEALVQIRGVVVSAVVEGWYDTGWIMRIGMDGTKGLLDLREGFEGEWSRRVGGLTHCEVVKIVIVDALPRSG